MKKREEVRTDFVCYTIFFESDQNYPWDDMRASWNKHMTKNQIDSTTEIASAPQTVGLGKGTKGTSGTTLSIIAIETIGSRRRRSST